MNLSTDFLEPPRSPLGGTGGGSGGDSAEARPIRPYALWSLLAHVVFFLALSLSIPPPQKPIFADPIYSVAVLESPVPNNAPPKPVVKQDVPKPKPPEPKSEVEPEEAPEVVKVKTEAPKKEAKKEEPPKEEPAQKPEPKKEVAEAKPLKPPAKRPDEAEAKTETPAPAVNEPVAVGMVDQKDFRHNYYLDRVRALIAQHWDAPPGRAGASEALVHFLIHRDGSYEAVEITQSSGSGIYDRAALRAVSSVNRFPPLPQSYSGGELGITVLFNTMRGGQ